MSVPRAMPRRAPAGADSILHPYFLRERLAPVLTRRPVRVVTPGDDFEVLRQRARAAVAAVGDAHGGRKGRAVHQVKLSIRRALYWYVEPGIDALRTTNLALIDHAEALSRDVERLRDEVASLRRDHDSELDARRRADEHATISAR